MKPEQINIATLAAQFSDEEAAWVFMEELRWPDGPVCPHCGSIGNAHLIKTNERKTRKGRRTFRREWTCQGCKRQFSVLVGTVFESSHVPLAKWLLALHMMCSNKNGVAALEIKRTLNVAYKTAWFMCHRIREAMTDGPLHDALQGVVMVDETYIGGHVKHMHRGKRTRAALRPKANKTSVVTLVERDGPARSRALERIDGANLSVAVIKNVDASATLVTDENPLYALASPMLAAHESVDHSKDRYVTSSGHSTNRVEGYFSQLKRSIDGTHHQVSRRHLKRYLAEFDFRYNTRKMNDGERTVKAVRKAAGKRLMYDKVVKG